MLTRRSFLPAILLAPTGPTTREAALVWFRKARFGLFIHYGLYSLEGRHEWLMFREKTRPADYARLAQRFTASRFDAARRDLVAEMAQACRKRGLRFFVFY